MQSLKKSSTENDERRTMNDEKAVATHRSPFTVHRSPPIVFMGSGPVAAKSLQLLSNTFHIEAVITKPSTEHEMSAACPDTPLLLVSSNRELEEIMSQQQFSARVCVLIDFGIIVSQTVIDSFENGIVNSHFSLLPELRGADPISFAILEGKKETGVSLMMVVQKMDEGAVLAQAPYQIKPGETTPSLTETLIEVSYALLKENLEAYLGGSVQPKSQEEWQKNNGKQISYTRKLTKQDGVIDWSKDAEMLEREIRAYQGWPRSRTKLGDVDVVVTQAHLLHGLQSEKKAGHMVIEQKAGCLAIECGDGTHLCIERLIPAGKKEMAVADFLRGYGDRIRG